MPYRSLHVVLFSTTSHQNCRWLRFGVNLRVPHQCACGAAVDSRGKPTNGLACNLALGRMARHGAMDNFNCRSLSSACICRHSWLWRQATWRTIANSLENVILVTWDTTVIHPLADSYLKTVSITACGAAELAANRQTVRKICCHFFQLIIPVNRPHNPGRSQIHGGWLFIGISSYNL